ncbi:MAG TPA: hypothetical protein VEY88_26520 [Archangium sp.]|nr:hypothetical protein [Archangium sp.]
MALPWMQVVAILLLAAGTTHAQPGRNEISVGVSTFHYSSYLRSSVEFRALDLSYHRPVGSSGFWRAVRVGGGLRTGLPAGAEARFPGELFVQAQLTARFGFWEPSVGPELGLSGFAKLDPRLPFPSVQLYQQEDADVGPLYVALNASPLRFRFGMFLVNAMEFQVGTSAPPLGVTTRTYLGLLRLGVAL